MTDTDFFQFSSQREPSSGSAVLSDSAHIQCAENIQGLLDCIGEMVFILNRERQIVFANQALLDGLGIENIEKALGIRAGEALNCINVRDKEDGCEESKSCRYCRTLQLILESQESGETCIDECRITSISGSQRINRDLQITASPFCIRGRQFTLVQVKDIGDRKRREQLERIFFHDILNAAGGLVGIAQFLNETAEANIQSHMLVLMEKLSLELVNDIRAQQNLLSAENGQLQTEFRTLPCRDIVEEVVNTIRFNDAFKHHSLHVIDSDSGDTVRTDRGLFGRVLLNMIKNGLEASRKDQTVSLEWEKIDDWIEFRVHNEVEMSDQVQNSIFQRSFSTKGHGRGLGTYSMKLLTERYLDGNIFFSTAPERGTTFHLRLPSG